MAQFSVVTEKPVEYCYKDTESVTGDDEHMSLNDMRGIEAGYNGCHQTELASCLSDLKLRFVSQQHPCDGSLLQVAVHR